MLMLYGFWLLVVTVLGDDFHAPQSVHVNLPQRIFASHTNWREDIASSAQLRVNSANNVTVSLVSKANSDNTDVWALYNWFWGVEKGVVVESGGFDGITFSVSHLFEKLADWQAILIEADLQNFGKMRRQRDQAININAALCNASSTLHYIPHKGTTGGIFEFMSSTYLQSWQSELVGPDKEKHLAALLPIQCVRISDLFRNIGIFHVDLWILDVEGAELSALQGVDWDRVSISTIIMETDGGDEAKDAAKRC